MANPNEMMKYIVIMAVACIVVIGGLAYVVVTNAKAPGTITYQTSGSNVTGVCPTTPTAGFPKLGFEYSYADQSNNGKITQVATGYNAFIVGNPSAIQAGTTSATAYTWINGTVNCGQKVLLVLGADGGSYMQFGVTPFAMTGAITQVNFNTGWKAANVLVPTFDNSTTFATNSVGLGQVAVAGGTYSNVKMHINGGAGSYAPAGVGIFAIYNSTAISNLYIPGLQKNTMFYPNPASVPAGYSVVGFMSPPIVNWSTTLTYPIVIQTSSGFVGNTAVSFVIDDGINFLQNGALQTAFVNPNSNAQLGFNPVNSMLMNAQANVYGFGTNSMSGAIRICKAAGCS